eukprot:TRINITY_DN83_c0_g5_i2.p1 TRINITY_DN83_c0_g5~~TRINITY_DN83_c0_g5_i2.p1  ORF type:complete len:776 (+),score=258.64 TRINITY_DN83_c0_g5_i2:278-2605(+)
MTVSGGETSGSLSLSAADISSNASSVVVGVHHNGVVLGVNSSVCSSSKSSSSSCGSSSSGSSSSVVPSSVAACLAGSSVASSTLGGLVPAAVSIKTKAEINTSLHLIKDIRRLESYQRNFFLKVKESLNAVQMLLDHQLMDMTWSENLMQCEENLLKTALQLTNVTPAQVSEIYGNLIRDRESLNRRFSELVSKSSLSEFIVNSGQILDVNTVRAATDAILKHEKPIRPKQDKSVPIDHTFFLANFCVSSLASGLMFRSPSVSSSKLEASSSQCLPLQQQMQAHRHVETSPSPASHPIHISHPSHVHAHHAMSSSPKKSNSLLSRQPDYNSLVSNGSEDRFSNGGSKSGVVVPSSLMDAVYYKSSTVAASVPTGPPPSTSDFSATAEAFVPQNEATSFSSGGGGLYGGQELVSAITQIAYQDQEHSSKKPSSPSVIIPVVSSAALPPKVGSVNPWQQQKEGVAGEGAYFNGFPSELAEVISDTVSNSSSSEDPRQQQLGSDVSKPLSFARIASLNLEKQAVGRALGGAGGVSMTPSPLLSNLATQNTSTGFGSFERQAAAAAHQAAFVAAVQQQQQQQQQVQQHQQQQHQVQHQPSLLLSPSLPPSLNPRFFLDIVMEGKKLGRVIIEVEPLLAPKMSQNFQLLVTGEKGFGYRGCHFFQAWKNESVICGDWEHNSGRGGRAATEGGTLFTPDDTKLPCVRGAVGMRRMSKKHSTLNQVASQFRIILANMQTQFSGIFGHVISGIEALDKVANVGGEGGRPEKIASVQNCGIYKP